MFARQLEMGIVPEGSELSRHDPDVPEWASLTDDERRLYSRMMEVFAGFLEHTDHQIGRVLDFLKSIGEYENTLVMVVSDNGASAEGGVSGTTNEAQFFNNAQEPFEDSLAAIDELGGPKHFNHYPWGWTWAGNTPFRRWKRETYRGGACDPFIVQWPAGIKARGEVREQYAHLVDMVPTVLDLLGIDPPDEIRGVTQAPLHGVSFAHTLDDPQAETAHHTQYFEMIGHRAIDHDGWRAVCPWPGPSFAETEHKFGDPIPADQLTALDRDGWELYHVAEDFAENHDVAADNPDKLREMIGRWYAEAGRYQVFPIDGSGLPRMLTEKPPVAATPADSFTFYPGTQSLPYFAGPKVLNRPHSITAHVSIPDGGAEGVLLSQGTAAGGYTLFVKDGLLQYTHNWVGRELLHVHSEEQVAPGDHELRFEFEPHDLPDPTVGHGMPGRFQLYIDGALVADKDFPYTTLFMFNPGSLTCGADPGSTVSPDYPSPFRFTGTIEKVTVDLSGDLIQDTEAELREPPGPAVAPGHTAGAGQRGRQRLPAAERRLHAPGQLRGVALADQVDGHADAPHHLGARLLLDVGLLEPDLVRVRLRDLADRDGASLEALLQRPLGLGLEEVAQHPAGPHVHVVDDHDAADLQRVLHVEPVHENLREGVRPVDEHEVQLAQVERRQHALGRLGVEGQRRVAGAVAGEPAAHAVDLRRVGHDAGVLGAA